MHSVLFVCTANICRSPMAMGLMQARVKREPDEWRVESAGIWAQRGLPAAQSTCDVLRSRGINLEDYRSRPCTQDLVEDINLILTMELNHRKVLRAVFPQHAGKIFMLSEMADRQSDVADPVGGLLSEFEETAREIDALLGEGYERIYRLASDDFTAERPRN